MGVVLEAPPPSYSGFIEASRVFHMKPLHPPSPRPELVVDPWGQVVQNPVDTSQVGQAGPLGRGRCLYALPTGGVGPQQFAPHITLHDHDGAFIADANSNLVGQQQAAWISRLLFARWTENTRR